MGTTTREKKEAQNPLLLRCHRLIEAFAKSDDERDFYLDKQEGFLLYVDLDKSQEELDALLHELEHHKELYLLLPKLSFYETKKMMEGFVHEKVYDIDTKEKLLDIIQSKEAREHFLEFIYDHHTEVEKWQSFYQERSRVRIIEWLRSHHFHFVFEEDLDLPPDLIEKIKQSLFDPKANKEVLAARKTLVVKAKTYYSNEALHPRPKRGRPPKQVAKQEVEPLASRDIFLSVPIVARPFLFIPELHQGSHLNAFSSRFETEKKRGEVASSSLVDQELSQKLASLRELSSRWLEAEQKSVSDDIDDTDTALFDEEEEDPVPISKNVPKSPSKKNSSPSSPNKPAVVSTTSKKAVAPPRAPSAPKQTASAKSPAKGKDRAPPQKTGASQKSIPKSLPATTTKKSVPVKKIPQKKGGAKTGKAK